MDYKTIELSENSWLLAQSTEGHWPIVMFSKYKERLYMEFKKDVEYLEGSFAEYVCKEYLRFIGEGNKE